MLLQVIEFSATDPAKSVLHHVAALAGAYRPDAVTAEGLTQYGWPGFSSYTLARAVLEGAAVVG